jgi:hypothetical protein
MIFNIKITALVVVALIIYSSKTNAQPCLTIPAERITYQNNIQAAGLFNFIRNIQVTPDTNFLNAAFVRVGYVPATNNLAVTFGSPEFTDTINGLHGGYAYKEYNLDMQPTGKYGALYSGGGDIGGLIVGNNFYAVNMDPVGWHIIKFDAVNWNKLVDIKFPLNDTNELTGDMMIAFVKGQLDISGQCMVSGKISPPDEGATTHHHFFSPDLDFLGERILSDTPHITGSTMIYVDSIYYFITATAYTGDVIVMKYDSNWSYLGMKKLVDQAHWSEGVAFDGQYFYISYLNTSLRIEPGFWPYYPNVHLAAFDRDWNLVDDVAVTDYTPDDSMFTGRPSLLKQGNRIFVSYDAVPLPEDLDYIEGYVSVYDLNPDFNAIKQNEKINKGFQLEQNFPNPCNSFTSITYSLPSPQMITLKVYDIQGREVAVLVNEVKKQGNYTANLDVSKLAAGVYYYNLMAGGFSQTRKCVVIK